MPHIHSDSGQHDLVVGGFLFKKYTDRYTVVLHRHKKYNKFLHFGGHVELDENIWHALMREIQEETGYEIGQLQILQPKDRLKTMSPETNAVLCPQPVLINTHTVPHGNNHSHIDIIFALIIEDKPNLAIGKNESAEIIEFEIEQIPKLLVESETLSFVSDAVNYIASTILDKWDIVPASSYETEPK